MTKNNPNTDSGLKRSARFDWVKSLLIAVSLALVIRWGIAEPFRIPSGSMEPTLHGDPRMFHGDRVFVNKISYGLRYPLNDVRIPIIGKYLHYTDTRLWHRADPKRWDIVVFKAVEPGALHATLVKRVVGLPGERIHIADGKVYVNDQPLELPPDMPEVYYTSPAPGQSDMKYGVVPQDEYSVVPEGSYLLLGDNSARSRDGRFFGWVPHEHILGRVSSIWWPIPRWRDFTGFSETAWWKITVTLVLIFTAIRLLIGRSWRDYDWQAGPGAKPVHYFINRWAVGIPIPMTRWFLYRWKLSRGMLVLYHPPKSPKNTAYLLAGRIAALPDERISFENDRPTVNGAPVLDDRRYPPNEATGPYTRSKSKDALPPNRVYILTEDPHSEAYQDSRTLGPISVSSIIGAAQCVWWPPKRMRNVKREIEKA